MDDKLIVMVVLAMVVIVVPLSSGLAWWLVVRSRRKSDRPLSHEPDGSVAVPVRGLCCRTFPFGSSRNSISPEFEITRDGLRFKVLKFDQWSFSEIERVDAPWHLLGSRIAFKARGGRSLFVDLADEAKARDLLKVLPTILYFTPRAVAMRDGIY